MSTMILAFFGMVVLLVLGGVCSLVALQVLFAVWALSGSPWKDLTWALFASIGAACIFLALYLSPFSVSIGVSS